MRLLLAEDNPAAASHVAAGLRDAAYAVDLAQDGSEALWLAENTAYDALVIDINMPGVDGISLVRRLRRDGINTPAIFVTARDAVADRIQGLDAGGDDYLVKPFSLEELLARLRALLRRQRPELSNVLRVADLEVDLLARVARRGQRVIALTNREFALLAFLAEASPRVVGRTAILEHVWEQHFDPGTNVVNVYIKYLRDKVGLPGEPQLIHTVRGAGFVLRPPDRE